MQRTLFERAGDFRVSAAQWLKAHPFNAVAWLLISCSVLLVLTLRYDQWDGAIIADFLETRDISGVSNWLLEGQGPFLLGVLWGIQILDGWLHLVDWRVFSSFGVFIGLFGLWRVAQLIWESELAAMLSLAVFALSPLASLHASSMHAAIFLFVGFGFLGLVAFYKGGLWRWCGIILMVLSVEIAPMCLLLPGIITVLETRKYVLTRSFDRFALVVAILLPIAYYLLYMQVFTAYGIYSTYNNFDAADVTALLSRLVGSTLLVYFVTPFAVSCLLLIALAFADGNLSRDRVINSVRMLLFVGLGLVVGLPYLLVNKSPEIYLALDPAGWFSPAFPVSDNSNLRHGVLTHLCMALAIGGAAVLSRSFSKHFLVGFTGLILLSQTSSFAVAWAENFARDNDIDRLVTTLSNTQYDRHHACRISLSDYPVYDADRSRFYELSYYAGLAGSDRSTFIFDDATSNRLLNFAINISCRSPAHQVKYGVGRAQCDALADREWVMSDLPDCIPLLENIESSRDGVSNPT
ncbi:MAG: hypothetical protein GYB36_12955 [Alphaproteobacteria bacterium]|nr:hypothetical protein [Alphaproteobacteria bacterium]